MGYLSQTLNGISWMGALRVVTRLFALSKIAFLARVLQPHQFGVYGIASLVLGFLEMLTETGINIFLVQKKENIDSYINSAWFVSVVRGIVIGICIFLLSPYISAFFNNTDTNHILYLVSLVPVVRGFINPSCVKYQKNLEFNKLFRYDSAIFLFDSVVAIGLGYLTKSENSLVYGMLAGTILEVFLSFIYFKPLPKFIFEKEKTLEVINSGRWITGAGIANYLFQNIDDIMVGRILGTASLGIYQQAYKISTIPVSEVGEVFNRVTFPIYVKLNGDRKRLKVAFFKMLAMVFLLSVAFGFIVFNYPSDIVKIVLGEQWLRSVPVLQILVIYGVLKAISNSFFSLFLGIEKQKVVTYITTFSVVILISILYPLIKIFGIIGAGYSTIIATILTIPVLLIYFLKYFKNE